MKAKISCVFQGGMAIQDYTIKEYKIIKIGNKEWLKITEDNDGISYINLENVNMYSLYEVQNESNISC